MGREPWTRSPGPASLPHIDVSSTALRSTLSTLVTLPLIGGLAASAPAQGFDAVRARIMAERELPAAQRKEAIGRLSKFSASTVLPFLTRLYRTEKDEAVRTMMVHQLGRHQHGSVVSALRGDLVPQWSYNHRWQVAHVLARQGQAGLRVLFKALESSQDHHTLLSVIYALGRPRVASARNALIRAFAKLPKYQVHILKALRDHETNRVLTGLRVDALAAEDPGVRAVAVYQLARQGHGAVREAALAQARQPDLLRRARALGEVFYALGRTLDAETAGALLELGQSIAEVRWAIHELSPAGEKRGAAFVADMAKYALRRPAAADRRAAVLILAECRHASANDLLVGALDDRSPEVVLAAVRALGVRGLATDRLKAFARAGDPELRDEALRAMLHKRRGDPDYADELVAALADEDVRIRIAAIDLLTELGHRPALAAVQARLGAETWPERAAVYAFCKRVRDKSSIPLLIDRLGTETGRLAAELQDLLESLSGKTYRNKDHWHRWWQAVAADFEVPPPAQPRAASASASKGPLSYHGLQIASRRVYFLVDVSGSMREAPQEGGATRLELAQSALKSVVAAFDENTSFNIVTFADDIDALSSRLKKATPKYRDKAARFIDALRANGGTNFYAALEVAFADEEVDTIYLLSDGVPSTGFITDEGGLVDEVSRWNRGRRVVVHTVAIGLDSKLMQRLSRGSGGQYVRRN